MRRIPLFLLAFALGCSIPTRVAGADALRDVVAAALDEVRSTSSEADASIRVLSTPIFDPWMYVERIILRTEASGGEWRAVRKFLVSEGVEAGTIDSFVQANVLFESATRRDGFEVVKVSPFIPWKEIEGEKHEVVALSLIGVNAKATQAVIHITGMVPRLNTYGLFLVLTRVDRGPWTVTARLPGWQS